MWRFHLPPLAGRFAAPPRRAKFFKQRCRTFLRLEDLEQRMLLCDDILGDDRDLSHVSAEARSVDRAELSVATGPMTTEPRIGTISIAEGESATSPQYTMKHPPRLQLGNAPLAGFPGSTADQVEVLWETIPAGTGTEDRFNIQYRKIGQTMWSPASPVKTIDTGVEGRKIHSASIKSLDYDADYEYLVQHLRANIVIGNYRAPFHTRLPTNYQSAFKFIAYGDSADLRSIANFRSVQSRINEINPEFALLLGDNIYTDGSHQQADARFDPVISPEAAIWNASHIDFAAVGNHDTNTSQGKPTEELFSVPIPVNGVTSSVQPPGTERPEHNYSFDYGNVHFLTFDSNSLSDASRLNGQLTWAEQDLKASSARWKVIFAHHPVAGVPDKPESPANNYYQQLVPRLRAAGVDLFLVGHSHTYSHTYPLLGQIAGQATYVLDTDSDYAKGAGLVQVVAGVGGTGLRPGDYGQFPFVAKGFTTTTSPASEFGFAQIEATALQLKVSYVAASDGRVLDTFTITDESAPPPVTISLQDGLDGYQGTRDTRIRGDFPTFTFGTGTRLEFDGNPDQVGLISWDLSRIPQNSLVTGGSFTLNVINPSKDTYEVYEALRPWDENSASFLLAATGKPWEVPGAAGATDHGRHVLASFTSLTTGLVTFHLTPSGLSAVQRWVNDSSRNFGFVIQDLTTPDGLHVNSREVAGLGPKLTVTYRPLPNRAPIARNLAVSTLEDISKSMTLTGFDVDGDHLQFSVEGTPANGTLTGTPPLVTYKPKPNYYGLDTFTYRISDGSLVSGIATVSVTVNAVNDRPVPWPLTVTTSEDVPISVTLTATDVDNNTLSYAIATGPGSGSLTGTAPNLTYTPNAGFTGNDSFTFQVTDPAGLSATATVTVMVKSGSTVAFQNGVLPSASYSGGNDTTIRASMPSTNFSTATKLEIDGNPDASSLFRWDISQIAPGNVVESASLTLNVVNPSISTFYLYQLLRPWVEAAATFQESNIGKPWQFPGAQGSTDRSTVVLGSMTATALGDFTIPLNSAGIAVVQAWINNPSINHGFILLNYLDSNDNKLEVTSKEGASGNTRPKLTIIYTSAVTSATASLTSAAAGEGSPTTAQRSYDVNRDSVVTPADALSIINYLNRTDTQAQAITKDLVFHYDISGDGVVSPIDVLMVFNHLNGPPAAEGEVMLDESLFLPIWDDQLDTFALASPGTATQIDHRDRLEWDAMLDECYWTAWDRHLYRMP